MELHEYTGEPTIEEILHRKADRERCGLDHLAIHGRCPACGKMNTEWIRNQWHICFDCEMVFTTTESNEKFFDLTEDEEMEEL